MMIDTSYLHTKFQPTYTMFKSSFDGSHNVGGGNAANSDVDM